MQSEFWLRISHPTSACLHSAKAAADSHYLCIQAESMNSPSMRMHHARTYPTLPLLSR